MSRELWLFRHGKAERYEGNEDYDRRLKKRGKEDASRIGEWLKGHDLRPDLVISSPATRAITTARLVCDALGIDRELIRMEKRLYEEGIVRMKSVLTECPNTASRVLLVGHNPELEDLLTYLVDSKQLPKVEKLLPTAALARLDLPDNWALLEKNCAELLSITLPKDLNGEDEDLEE